MSEIIVKKYRYEIYESLLVINLMLIFFTRPINFLPNSPIFAILGFILVLIAAIVDVYWEIFWYKSRSKRLITNGIYKYIRHPFMSVLILASFGLVISFNYLQSLSMTIISTFIIYVGAKKEEAELVKNYGSKYKEYMKKVRYRFIPKMI